MSFGGGSSGGQQTTTQSVQPYAAAQPALNQIISEAGQLYNQGVGHFIADKNNYNLTYELGLAYDNSDYLNSQIRTSFLKNSISLDVFSRNIKGKLEVDHFNQISEKIHNKSLSRLQILGEFQLSINNLFDIVIGSFQEYQNKKIIHNSISMAFSISKPINWDL